ncbi:hypothetical protein SVIOM342S_07785 [Streptomyces violaceorubidus]
MPGRTPRTAYELAARRRPARPGREVHGRRRRAGRRRAPRGPAHHVHHQRPRATLHRLRRTGEPFGRRHGNDRLAGVQPRAHRPRGGRTRRHASPRSPAADIRPHSFGKDRLDFRPKEYWKPGTEVTVDLDLRDVEGAKGVYGLQHEKVSFTVGRSQVSRVDAVERTMQVRRDGTLMATVPITAGAPTTPTYNGRMVITEMLEVTRMNSRTVGFGGEYDIPDVPHAIRLTSSGTFLHGNYWAARRHLRPGQRQPRLRRTARRQGRRLRHPGGLVLRPQPHRRRRRGGPQQGQDGGPRQRAGWLEHEVEGMEGGQRGEVTPAAGALAAPLLFPWAVGIRYGTVTYSPVLATPGLRLRCAGARGRTGVRAGPGPARGDKVNVRPIAGARYSGC